jgi:hypothetical protein
MLHRWQLGYDFFKFYNLLYTDKCVQVYGILVLFLKICLWVAVFQLVMWGGKFSIENFPIQKIFRNIFPENFPFLKIIT